MKLKLRSHPFRCCCLLSSSPRLLFFLIPFLTRESLSKSPKATHLPSVLSSESTKHFGYQSYFTPKLPTTDDLRGGAPFAVFGIVRKTGSLADSTCSWGPRDGDAEEEQRAIENRYLTTSSSSPPLPVSLASNLSSLPSFSCVNLSSVGSRVSYANDSFPLLHRACMFLFLVLETTQNS